MERSVHASSRRNNAEGLRRSLGPSPLSLTPSRSVCDHPCGGGHLDILSIIRLCYARSISPPRARMRAHHRQSWGPAADRRSCVEQAVLRAAARAAKADVKRHEAVRLQQREQPSRPAVMHESLGVREAAWPARRGARAPDDVVTPTNRACTASTTHTQRHISTGDDAKSSGLMTPRD
jgi:hypothetical protein